MMNNLQRYEIAETIQDLKELEKWISNRVIPTADMTHEETEQTYPFGCGYARGISESLRERLTRLLDQDS